MTKPLEGMLVIGLEQAVAAPLCTCRLADAGARVIKIERPEGDFARGYDECANGLASYFVWLNRGKESLVLDLRQSEDKLLLANLLASADVLVQNLRPGALKRLGISRKVLRQTYPSLIVASISGFGDGGPYAARKAYDLLIQAEAGLASLTGGPEAPTRVGVSVVDIATGMNTYAAILEALLRRARTGEGADIRVSMFDSTAEWSTVPLLQHRSGKSPQRVGLAHPTIAPYGSFHTNDGIDILISIQSDREWVILAAEVLKDPELAANQAFATNVQRVAQRAQTDAAVQHAFIQHKAQGLAALLSQHDIAFGFINDMQGLDQHPHLRQIEIMTSAGMQRLPAPAAGLIGEPQAYGKVPSLGEHSERLRAEFAGTGLENELV